MPEPEPVREPAPPPPRECRRRRRRSGSSASSRACRAQRRLHLGWAGDGEGAGPARERAGRARPQPWNPRPAGCPARGLEAGGRGSRPRATLPQPQHATAPPTEQGRSGGCDPAPYFKLGEGARERGPSALIGPQQGCPAHGLGRIPPRSASAGYCYNPGFPGATGMGRGSEHLAPPSIPGRNAPPLFLDTPPSPPPPPPPRPGVSKSSFQKPGGVDDGALLFFVPWAGERERVKNTCVLGQAWPQFWLLHLQVVFRGLSGCLKFNV